MTCSLRLACGSATTGGETPPRSPHAGMRARRMLLIDHCLLPSFSCLAGPAFWFFVGGFVWEARDGHSICGEGQPCLSAGRVPLFILIFSAGARLLDVREKSSIGRESRPVGSAASGKSWRGSPAAGQTHILHGQILAGHSPSSSLIREQLTASFSLWIPLP